MRYSTTLKLLSIAALGVCTMLTTNSILGQIRTQKKNASRSDPLLDGGTRTTGTTTLADVRPVTPGEFANVKPDQDLPRKNVAASFRLQSMEATANGRTVTVGARAYIRDTRPNVEYVWSLRVSQLSTRKLVSGGFYDQQIFSVPIEQELSPTFSEQFQLVPGKFLIEVSLYEVPGRLGVGALSKPAIAEGQHLLTGSKVLTVVEN
jgi:hypothetical protein